MCTGVGYTWTGFRSGSRGEDGAERHEHQKRQDHHDHDEHLEHHREQRDQRDQRADESLCAFYSNVFEAEVFDRRYDAPLPRHVEVADLEATLARVWDLGGTIVSAPDQDRSSESPAAASFRDPRGNLVSVFTARRPRRRSPTSATM